MKGVEEVPASEILGSSMPADHLAKVKKYNFKRPDKFSKEQLRTLQMVHEAVVRELRPVLSTRTGINVGMEVAAIDQLTFGEFMRSVPEHGLFAPMRMLPLRGSALLEIDPALADLFLETACGQPAEVALSAPKRTERYSEADQTVLAAVVESMIPALESGWRALLRLSAEVMSIEADRRDCMIVPPTEMTVLVSLELVAGPVTAMVNLALPYLTIEPILEKLSAIYWYSSVRRGPASQLTEQSPAWNLDVACEIGIDAGRIALADLPEILNGMPLPLDAIPEAGGVLTAGGVDVAMVRLEAADLATDRITLPIVGADAQSVVEQIPSNESQSSALRDERNEEILRGIRELRASVNELRSEHLEIEESESYPQPRALSVTEESASDLAILVSGERPSLVAFLLAALDEQVAARILAGLPAELRPRVVSALTTLVAADRVLHSRLVSFLVRRIKTSRESNVTGGAGTAASILNHVPASVEIAVMTKIQADSKETFESIAQLMFVFEDFVLLDANAIAKVAARVEPAEFALAFKGLAKEILDHIESAFSDEYAEAVRKADGPIGRVRKQDVEAARKEIIEELNVLEKEGEIVIARADEIVE